LFACDFVLKYESLPWKDLSTAVVYVKELEYKKQQQNECK